MNNFPIIYKILSVLELAMDLEAVNLQDISAERFKISQNRWATLLEMMAREGFIDGVTVKRTIDGEKTVAFSSPRITFKGLQYLQKDSTMESIRQMLQDGAQLAQIAKLFI